MLVLKKHWGEKIAKIKSPEPAATHIMPLAKVLARVLRDGFSARSNPPFTRATNRSAAISPPLKTATTLAATTTSPSIARTTPAVETESTSDTLSLSTTKIKPRPATATRVISETVTRFLPLVVLNDQRPTRTRIGQDSNINVVTAVSVSRDDHAKRPIEVHRKRLQHTPTKESC